MSDRPNVLWFCTDQQRYDTIAALGNPHIRTPNLDAFLQRSVAFTHAFAQSPVCTPSRASFLTGRYPRTCRGRQNGQEVFPADEVLVTRLLADAGYDAGLSGKLHLSACQGRSEKRNRVDDGYRNFWWSHHPAPDWEDSDYALWLAAHDVCWEDLYQVPSHSRHAYPGVPTAFHQTTWCVEMAIEHIREHRDGPWLMSVNPFDPHHPFDPPREYLERYDPKTVPSPRWRPGEWDHKSPYQVLDHQGAYGGAGMSVERLTEHQLREIVAAYYAMIELIDDQFGRLLSCLDDCGELDNTIVIFMSDHGEMLGDHGILLKGPHFYDCAVRVPLLLSWPGHWREGLVCDALVELLDLAPTLCEACGIEVPERMQGRSLGPLLTGQTTTHREDVYAEYHYAMPCGRRAGAPPYATMLRSANHKVVVYHGIEAGELYDLEADPDEFENLWGSPAHRDLRDRLVKRCFDRAVFTCDPWPPRVAGF